VVATIDFLTGKLRKYPCIFTLRTVGRSLAPFTRMDFLTFLSPHSEEPPCPVQLADIGQFTERLDAKLLLVIDVVGGVVSSLSCPSRN
jgi:hypothetical protein